MVILRVLNDIFFLCNCGKNTKTLLLLYWFLKDFWSIWCNIYTNKQQWPSGGICCDTTRMTQWSHRFFSFFFSKHCNLMQHYHSFYASGLFFFHFYFFGKYIIHKDLRFSNSKITNWLQYIYSTHKVNICLYILINRV